MTYTVKYKPIRGLFWRRIRNVKADGVVEVTELGLRWFLCADASRHEIATAGMHFRFSKERCEVIRANAEAAAAAKDVKHGE